MEGSFSVSTNAVGKTCLLDTLGMITSWECLELDQSVSQVVVGVLEAWWHYNKNDNNSNNNTK